jgi:DNA uptake protein ComE-like DNA-binding protein
VKNLVLATALCLLLAGCTGPQQKTPEQIKQETADATAKVKSTTEAMVAGVREGLKRKGPLDLNSASKDDLMALPGVTSQQADLIIADRPFRSAPELVTRHIVSQREYDQIKNQVMVK